MKYAKEYMQGLNENSNLVSSSADLLLKIAHLAPKFKRGSSAVQSRAWHMKFSPDKFPGVWELLSSLNVTSFDELIKFTHSDIVDMIESLEAMGTEYVEFVEYSSKLNTELNRIWNLASKGLVAVFSEGKRLTKTSIATPYQQIKDFLKKLGYKQEAAENQAGTFRTWFSNQPVNKNSTYTLRELMDTIKSQKIELGDDIEISRNEEGNILITKFKPNKYGEMERDGIDTIDLKESTKPLSEGRREIYAQSIDASASKIIKQITDYVATAAIRQLKLTDRYRDSTPAEIEDSDDFIEMTLDIQTAYIGALIRKLQHDLHHPLYRDDIVEAII